MNVIVRTLRWTSALLLFSNAIAGGPTASASETLAEAVQSKGGVKCEIRKSGRNELKIACENPGKEELDITAAAGSIFRSGSGGKMVALRETRLTVPPGGSAEALIPAAATEITSNIPDGAVLSLTSDANAELEPLLKYLATNPDVPRATSQLLVFSITDDVTFSKWDQFLAAQSASDASKELQQHPSPAEITSAVDAIGVLKEIAPGRTFALEGDQELKARALHTPVCRVKAMQLYGMTLPGDPAGTPASIGQLLHTRPGDNCPICRMRAQMQGAQSDL